MGAVKRKVPQVWVVSEPGPERPWHTNESWNVIAVYGSETEARYHHPGERHKIEPVVYYPAATPKGGAK